MLMHILPLIPEHDVYLEAFAGGAAVFFAKQKSTIEVLNDVNGNVANFYRVMHERFDELLLLVEGSLYCEYSYKQAKRKSVSPDLIMSPRGINTFGVIQ